MPDGNFRTCSPGERPHYWARERARSAEIPDQTPLCQMRTDPFGIRLSVVLIAAMFGPLGPVVYDFPRPRCQNSVFSVLSFFIFFCVSPICFKSVLWRWNFRHKNIIYCGDMRGVMRTRRGNSGKDGVKQEVAVESRNTLNAAAHSIVWLITAIHSRIDLSCFSHFIVQSTMIHFTDTTDHWRKNALPFYIQHDQKKLDCERNLAAQRSTCHNVFPIYHANVNVKVAKSCFLRKFPDQPPN